MTAYVVMAVWLQSFLTSVIDGISDYLHATAALAPGKVCVVPTK